MRIETFYKLLLGIIIVVIICQIKDNVVSKNEIEKCYKENYTFVYKQETLSNDLAEQFLKQLSDYNYSKEKNKKDTDEYQFANSIFIPERKIVLHMKEKLAGKFASINHAGPKDVTDFLDLEDEEEIEMIKRDAYEQVQALLNFLDEDK